jgi:hypothetical protein
MIIRWWIASVSVQIIAIHFAVAQLSSQGITWVGTVGDTAVSVNGLPPWDLRDFTIDPRGNSYFLRSNSLQKCGKDGGSVWSRRFKLGKEPGSFRFPSSLSVDSSGNIYVLDINRVSVLDLKGEFVRSFPVVGVSNRLWCWRDSQLLLLGSFQGNIFCVYNVNGMRERNFGKSFKPIWELPERAYAPREWFVSSDTIWVANPWQYEIREYIGERLVASFKGGDRFPRPAIGETESGNIAIGTSQGIFGLAASQGQLLVSIVVPSGNCVLDVLSAGSLRHSRRLKDFLSFVRTANRVGQLFFIEEGKVRIGRIETKYHNSR